MMTPRFSVLVLCAALAACGGGGGGNSGSNGGGTGGPPPAPILTLSAPVTQVLAGAGPVSLSASAAPAGSISWELAPGAPGSLSASGGTAQYTPPASVGANTPVTLTARAGADSRSVTLTVFPDPGPAGLSFLAGSLGDRALLDGPAPQARFGEIVDSARLPGGGMVVADRLFVDARHEALRQVAPDGAVTTLLRSSGELAPDGDLGQAGLGTLQAVGATADGAIWFAEHYQNQVRLRKLAKGMVSTVLNHAPPISRIVPAPDGTLYLLSNTSILQLAPGASTPLLLAGADVPFNQPPQDGAGAAARFSQPTDLALAPSGDLFTADGCALRKITPAGVVSTVAGNVMQCSLEGIDGAAPAARFAPIRSLAVGSAGEVLALESGKVRSLSAAGIVGTHTTLGPRAMQTGYTRQSPAQQVRTTAAGQLMLVHQGEIRRLAAPGQALPYAGLEDDSSEERDGPGASARFPAPQQLAADLAGNIYVLGTNIVDTFIPYSQGLRLQRIAPDGQVSTLVRLDLSFQQPSGMATDAKGRLYLVESRVRARMSSLTGGALYRLDASGARTLLAGRPAAEVADHTAPVDGPGTLARFMTPSMAGIDSDGNIYLHDQGKVRKVTPEGVVSTVAGVPTSVGKAPDGLLYKVDGRSRAVRVNADGSETLVAGGRPLPGTVLGALPGGLSTPPAIVPTGPSSFAVISGSAVLKLVLPR